MSAPRLLSIALVAQLALLLVTWWPSDRSAHAPHALLDLTPDAITGITIERKPNDADQPSTPLELVRENGAFRIRSKLGYPADPEKVQDLLRKLLEIRVGEPIATRESSHNALHVGEKDYGRRITLRAGESEHSLIVGAAKSRSANVRLAGRPEVYLAEGLSEWSLSDTARSYWATDYVDVEADELSALDVQNEHASFRLVHDEQGWRLDPMPAESTPDTQAIESLLASVLHLTLTEPVSDEIQPDYGLDAGARVSWTIEAEDRSIGGGYRVGAEDAGSHYVKSDSSPFVVKVGKSALSALFEARAEDMVSPAAPAEADTEADTETETPDL